MLAALSAALAAGAVLRDSAPDKAMAVSPLDGFAPADAALRALRAIGPASAARLGPAQEREQRALADASRRREPLSPRPLALMAMSAERRGDFPGARGLMAAALALSRRDPNVNAWFVADAGRSGDLGATVAAIGRSILTEPSTASLYLPPLAATLADASTIPVFAHILRPRPAWELLFWREVGINQAALRNAGELRAQLHRTAPDDFPTNRALIQQLAGAAHYETAERLYRSIVPRTPAGAAIVRDERFTRPPALPPFDWQEIADGEQSGTIDPTRHRLLVGGIGGAGGTAARQLVRLPAGRYRLVAERDAAANGVARVAVDLGCTAGGASIVSLTLVELRVSRDFVSDGGCAYLWLTIRTVPSDEVGGYDLALRRVAISRLPGA